MAPAVSAHEVIYAIEGRGVHLAARGHFVAICGQPVLLRTGRPGDARTPHLCEACARTLRHLGGGAQERTADGSVS